MIVAETSTDHSFTHSVLYASMGPRLDSRGNGRTARASGAAFPASMGPRLDSRGNPRSSPYSGSGDGASMGPRLDSRGNRAACISELLRQMRLQWGRDLIVAETPASRSCRTTNGRLQWGRDLIVAETALLIRTISDFDGASMGPRLDSRGNLFRFRFRQRGYGASMGPRLDSRGNRFMSAAICTGSPLQWGRDLIVAETSLR